jgi:hypothetical protein
MQTHDRESADVFADYHRHDSRRRLLAAGVVAVVVVLGGGAAAVAAASNASDDVAAPAAVLTATDFFPSINGAFENTQFHADLTLESEGRRFTMSGDFATEATDDVLSSVKIALPDSTTARVRMVDGITYLDLGAPTGGKFLRLDPDDEADPLAAAFTGATKTLDPGAMFDIPAAAVMSVDVAGPAVELDGVQAVPYTVVIDTVALAASSGAPDVAGVTAELTYTYWIGPENLLRRVVIDMGGSTIDAVYRNWGKPVSIVAPSADQLTTLDELAQP